MAAICARTGLPVHSAFFKASGNATITLSETLASTRLASPAVAFPEGKQQVCWQQEFLQQALAARGARADPCRAVAVRRHQALFHATARAHPNHFPSGGAHLFGDRQSREDVAAGAACHDEDGAAHACNPRASWRFSQSMRSRIASATKLASKPEPPELM